MKWYISRFEPWQRVIKLLFIAIFLLDILLVLHIVMDYKEARLQPVEAAGEKDPIYYKDGTPIRNWEQYQNSL